MRGYRPEDTWLWSEVKEQNILCNLHRTLPFFYEMVRRQGLEISFRRKIVLHLYAFGDSPGFVRVAYLVLTKRTF